VTGRLKVVLSEGIPVGLAWKGRLSRLKRGEGKSTWLERNSRDSRRKRVSKKKKKEKKRTTDRRRSLLRGINTGSLLKNYTKGIQCKIKDRHAQKDQKGKNRKKLKNLGRRGSRPSPPKGDWGSLAER